MGGEPSSSVDLLIRVEAAGDNRRADRVSRNRDNRRNKGRHVDLSIVAQRRSGHQLGRRTAGMSRQRHRDFSSLGGQRRDRLPYFKALFALRECEPFRRGRQAGKAASSTRFI